MTQVLLTKQFGGLRPASDDAFRVLSKIKDGAGVVAEIKDQSRRSVEQHRFWFALANMLFEAQDYFKDFETFRKCLLIKLGYVDIYEFKDGTKVPIPHSMKFSKMPQDEINSLVDATLDFAETLGFDRNELLAETRERIGA